RSIDVLCEGQIVAQSANVSRGHAEIRGDLPLDGEIELIAIRPLEVLGEAEERPSGSKELRRNERKRIGAGYAAAAPGGTSHGRTKRRARSIFRHQLIVWARKRRALRHGRHARTRHLLSDVGETETHGGRLEIRDRVPFVA